MEGVYWPQLVPRNKLNGNLGAIEVGREGWREGVYWPQLVPRNKLNGNLGVKMNVRLCYRV